LRSGKRTASKQSRRFCHGRRIIGNALTVQAWFRADRRLLVRYQLSNITDALYHPTDQDLSVHPTKQRSFRGGPGVGTPRMSGAPEMVAGASDIVWGLRTWGTRRFVLLRVEDDKVFCMVDEHAPEQSQRQQSVEV
jgi:hypothetical protein